MFSKVMLKLLFLFGAAAALLLTAAPFISAAPSGGALAYLPLVYAPGQNSPPAFGFLAIVPATQGEPYDLTVQASDPDEGDALTLSALQLPNWLAIQPTITNTWILTGTPTNDDEGENFVHLQVTDSAGGNDVVTFTLTVLDGNDDPYFQPIPPEQLEILEDVAYTLTVTAVDPDGDEVTIVADEKPAWLTLQNSGNGQVTLMGTPLNEDVGANLVDLRAIDSAGYSSSTTFTITVINVNDDPYFIGTTHFTATIGEPAPVLYVVAEDPDPTEDLLIINQLNGLPSWLTIGATEDGQAQLIFSHSPISDTVTPPGTYIFTLQVADEAGATDIQTYTLTILPPQRREP
jgi:hypothetical protein